MRNKKDRLSAVEVHRRQRTQSGILIEAEVAHIKWRLLQGHNKRMLAQVYDVSLWTIRAIDRGDTWTWVQPQCMTDTGVEETLDEIEEMSEQPPTISPEVKASMDKLKSMTAEIPVQHFQPSADLAERAAAYGVAVSPPADTIKSHQPSEVGTIESRQPAGADAIGSTPADAGINEESGK